MLIRPGWLYFGFFLQVIFQFAPKEEEEEEEELQTSWEAGVK